MELKSFVKKSLIDIVSALEEVEKESNREIHLAKPNDNKCVNFDVAVTVEKTLEGSAKGKTEGIIKVLGASIEGDIGGEYKSGNVSRISFGVYVNSQNKQQQADFRQEVKQLNQKHSRY